MGEIKLVVSVHDALSAYEELSDNTTSFSEHSDFIQQGLNYVNSRIEANKTHMGLTAFTCHRLNEVYNKIFLELPTWLPETYRVNPWFSSDHRFTYLFNWGTCDVATIPNSIADLFFNNLISFDESSEKPQKPTLASVGIEKEPRAQKTMRHVTAAPSVDHSKLAETVQHGVYVAKKYLTLLESAQSRNLEFNLSIEDFSALLRNNRCYFTGEELVSYPAGNMMLDGKLQDFPANYLTIDRLRSDRGYVLNNIVTCAHSINQLKSRMNDEEFQKAITMRKFLRDSNMTVEQLAILGIAG